MVNTNPCTAVGEVCSDISARWVILFSKGEGKESTSFHLKFNDSGEMNLAISRAKAAGYTAKAVTIEL